MIETITISSKRNWVATLDNMILKFILNNWNPSCLGKWQTRQILLVRLGMKK